MSSIEWGEFRLGDLFDINNTTGLNTDKLVDGTEYDYITRTSLNQGILKTTGFINQTHLNESRTWSLGLLQMDFFYRNKPWYAGQFVRKIIPKFDLSRGSILFLTTILNKQKKVLLSVLVRDVDEVFKNIKIKLPINSDGEIDFEFMESFVSELEAERVAELEAYLAAASLKDYSLTAAELSALSKFENYNWGEFRIGDLFIRLNTKKLPYKAKDLPVNVQDKFNLPCLTSSFNNQGLNYFAPRDGATILKNVISLPSNSDVYRGYFQSRDFTVLSDAYVIDWINKETKHKIQSYLFSLTSINKVTDLPIYSYKNKLGGWNVVRNKLIQLPINKDGDIDFEFMNNFIKAIEKLVIKDVVLYADNKIKATKSIVSSNQ